MVLSEPCRVHICDDRNEVCVRVDFATRRQGNVIEIKSSEVSDFTTAIFAADDELNEKE